MRVLQTMWGRAVQIRARRAFALGTVLASLLLVALPRALALDPGRRISQHAHTAWRVHDGAFAGAPTAITQTTEAGRVPRFFRRSGLLPDELVPILLCRSLHCAALGASSMARSSAQDPGKASAGRCRNNSGNDFHHVVRRLQHIRE
jgi:hypothetical protein